MKKQFKHLVLYFPLLITLSAFSGNTQNQFKHISARENRFGNGNGTMLDNPDINNNPKAILFVTQKDPGLNPHPICVYYFKGKWNIMNLDQARMPEDAEFSVEYFTSPDKDHFQYLIKKENLQQKDGSAFIDHPALNNHPDAQFSVFHSWVPEANEYGNNAEVQTQYDPGAGKWVLRIVSNLVNKSLPVNSAYNINITSAGYATKPVNTTPANTTPVNTTPVNTTPVNTTPVNTTPTTTAATGNSGSGPIGANLMFMTVWENGIKLPGESPRAAHFDKIEVVDFEMGVARAADAATGQSSGKKMYELITIKKLTGGAATIPYFNAFLKNSTLVVTIETYSTNTITGAVELNYTLKLSDARFRSFKQILEQGNSIHTPVYLDVIKISFLKIEFIKDGVSVMDTQ